jgi:adenylate kinase family enzyme
MNKGIVLTTCTGGRGCGKSKTLQLINLLCSSPAVVLLETSEIIRWQMKQTGDLGEALREAEPLVKEGKFIPDNLVIPTCEHYFNRLRKKRPEVCHILLSGYPRTYEQKRLFKLFDAVRIIHIRMDESEKFDGVKLRQAAGISRDDDHPTSIEQNWTDYTTNTLPAMDKFGDQVLHLNRREPIFDRLRKSIDHLPVPDQVRSRLLRRLETRSHPVHVEIRKVESLRRHIANGQIYEKSMKLHEFLPLHLQQQPSFVTMPPRN